jgi:hypothetical protein
MPTHTAEITIQASPQRVFEALTKPELVKLWQYGRVVMTDWKVGSKITFRSEGPGSAAVLEEWGTILDIRPNEFIKYNLFTPSVDLEDKLENYCVTSYVVSDDNGHARIEIIQEDNRPSGFAPATLKPILVALKSVAETN